MNERIRELSELATACANHAETGNRQTNYRNAFAELIVRECAEFLEDNSGYDSANNSWHPEPEDLLKHFGVEE